EAGERTPLRPVRVDESGSEFGADCAQTVEALVQALRREPAEEVDEPRPVVGEWWPQPKRAAVSEDDVDRVGCSRRQARSLHGGSRTRGRRRRRTCGQARTS